MGVFHYSVAFVVVGLISSAQPLPLGLGLDALLRLGLGNGQPLPGLSGGSCSSCQSGGHSGTGLLDTTGLVGGIVDGVLPLLLNVVLEISLKIGQLPSNCQNAFQKVHECTQQYGGNLQGSNDQVLADLLVQLKVVFNNCLTDQTQIPAFLTLCLKIQVLIKQLGDPTCKNDPSLDLILKIVVQLELLLQNPPAGTILSDLLDVVLTQVHILTNYLPCILNLNNLDFFLSDVLNGLLGAVTSLPNLQAALQNIVKYQKLFIQQCNGTVPPSNPSYTCANPTPSPTPACGCNIY